MAVQNRHGASTVELRWTPGHDGILGNERADVEAKVAANGDSSLAWEASLFGMVTPSNFPTAKKAIFGSSLLFPYLTSLPCIHLSQLGIHVLETASMFFQVAKVPGPGDSPH